MSVDGGGDRRALAGALLLARFNRAGLALMGDTPDAAWRSFRAAFYALPLYAVLLAAEPGSVPNSAPSLQVALVEAIAYVVGWTAFAVVMIPFARNLGRLDRYPLFLGAYNWTSLVQIAALTVATLPVWAGLLPADAGATLVTAVTLGCLVYEWFVIRTALEIGPFSAAGAVVVDLLLTTLNNQVAYALLAKPSGA